MLNFILQKFTRKISGERNYMPSADGIRALALIHVVTGHIMTFILGKSLTNYSNNTIQQLILNTFTNSGYGLNIFFVLSGFLLILPFANYYKNGTKKPSTALYFIRRLIRIELPYFVALIFSTVLLIWVIKKFEFVYLFPRFIASFFYSNTIIYNVHPDPLPLAWSLETEVQFYIFVPIFALIFKYNKIIRRLLLVLLIIAIPITVHHYNFRSNFYFVYYAPYFFSGILIADLYLYNEFEYLKKQTIQIITIILFAIIFWYLPLFCKTEMILNIYSPLIIAAFIYCIIGLNAFKIIFANKYITILGVISYTVYLWHYMIISFFEKYTLKFQLGNNILSNVVLQCIIILPLILIFSSTLFLLIEKPCMYSKLPKKIYTKCKSILK